MDIVTEIFDGTFCSLEYNGTGVIGLLSSRFGVDPDEIQLLPHHLRRESISSSSKSRLFRAILTSISSSTLSQSRAEIGTELGILYRRSTRE